MRPWRHGVWWVLLVLGLWLGLLLVKPAEPPSLIAVACPDIVAGCGLPHDRLLVQFDRQPRPMQPFHLRVELPGVTEMHARFAMRGMEMGPNRYRLLAEGAGRWHAEVLLPACVQGRNDWEVLIEVAGRTYVVPFQSG